MKILLTGSRGFIGRHLERHFSKVTEVEELHCTIRRIEDKNGEFDHVLDLTDRFAVKSLLNTVKPDVILHFAANPNTKLDNDNPTLITTNNIVSTQNLLHYAPKNCRFIFASSILVYGEQDDAAEYHPCNPTTVYGATKLACEGLVSAYSNMGLIRGCSIRLSATVGKGLTHGILFDFMRKIYSSQKEFEILGSDPGSSKPFLHVNDICDVVQGLLELDVLGPFGRPLHTLNVCPDDNLSAKNIAELVMGITGITKPIKFLGDNSTWIGDNKVLKCSNLWLSANGLKLRHPTSTIAMATAIREIHETQQISR